MNWFDMPPLAALRAFSAFAESGNVVQAGAALNVSHAAISQQLRALEKYFDTALLDRSGRTMVLTEEGAHLARALSLGFGAIGSAVDDLLRQKRARPLHISTTAAFAAGWLMPRLSAFRASNPDIDLMIDASPTFADLTPGGVDLAIRYGHGDWPGLTCEKLFDAPLAIVAAPDLIGNRRITEPAELLDLPWLEETGRTEATSWLRSQGVTDQISGAFIQVPGNLYLSGVRAGQGVAVTVRAFVEREIAQGDLIEVFADSGAGGYHIVTRSGVQAPRVKTLIRWLKQEARAMR